MGYFLMELAKLILKQKQRIFLYEYLLTYIKIEKYNKL